MNNGEKFKANPSFDAFISNAQHEARIDTSETPIQHAARLLSEVDETISEHHIQSSEEAIANLAKLDIVIEVADNPDARDSAMKAKAEELKTTIKERYPIMHSSM